MDAVLSVLQVHLHTEVNLYHNIEGVAVRQLPGTNCLKVDSFQIKGHFDVNKPKKIKVC